MWAPNQWHIIAGEEAKIVAHLFDKNGDPLNISGATAIKMKIKNADGSFLERAAETGFTYGPANQQLYMYGFPFTPEETAAFSIAANQSVMMKVYYGDVKFHCYLIKKALNVELLSI